jgi:hypothetical protein
VIGSNDIDNTDNSRIVIVGYTYGSGESGNIKYLSSTTGSHIFLSGGGVNERMRITSTGNVGIGTNTVSNILQVGSGERLRISNGATDYTVIGTSDLQDGTNTRIAIFAGNVSGSPGQIHYVTTSLTGSHNFYTTNSVTTNTQVERMRITSTGNVGIGTNTFPSDAISGSPILAVGSCGYGICGDSNGGSTGGGIYIGDGLVSARWKLTHGGMNLNLYQNNGSGTYNYRGAFANSTGAYSSVSDKRLKKLIEPIQYGLNDVLKFKPVSYLMENQNEDIDKRNLGFIAQDLEYIIPEIVNVPSSSNAVYSLQYTSIIPILIKAIQELNEIVTKNTNTSNMIV